MVLSCWEDSTDGCYVAAQYTFDILGGVMYAAWYVLIRDMALFVRFGD